MTEAEIPHTPSDIPPPENEPAKPAVASVIKFVLGIFMFFAIFFFFIVALVGVCILVMFVARFMMSLVPNSRCVGHSNGKCYIWWDLVLAPSMPASFREEFAHNMYQRLISHNRILKGFRNHHLSSLTNRLKKPSTAYYALHCFTISFFREIKGSQGRYDSA